MKRKSLLLLIPVLLIGCEPKEEESKIKLLGKLTKDNINNYLSISTTKDQKYSSGKYILTFTLNISNLYSDYKYVESNITYNWGSPCIAIPDSGNLMNYQWQYELLSQIDLSTVILKPIGVNGTIYKKLS